MKPLLIALVIITIVITVALCWAMWNVGAPPGKQWIIIGDVPILIDLPATNPTLTK